MPPPRVVRLGFSRLALPARRERLRLRSFSRRVVAGSVLLFGFVSLQAQPESTDDRVVTLPPFMVEETTTPLVWRYCALPGMEIISVCDERTSVDYARRVRRLEELLHAVLPERFTARTAFPETAILFDDRIGRARSKEVISEMMQAADARASAKGVVRANRQATFMPNLRLLDLDATAIFAISPSESFTYAESRIASLLDRRVPALPDWFVAGTKELYRQIELEDREIVFLPAPWLSREESLALGMEPEKPPGLLPLPELFARQRTRADDPDPTVAHWRAQCALFLRWAIVANNGSLREALWKFVDRLEQESASEELFQEYFGRSYAEMNEQLSVYLAGPAKRRTYLSVPRSEPPRPVFRLATPLEVARIRGDWERMEITYVGLRQPALLQKYADQARQTLRKAYDAGERDPQLLAIMGLTEMDASNPAAAQPLLEAAVSGGVVRPRAYVELARLRFEALRREIGSEGKLDAAQIDTLFGLLRQAHRQQPPLAETYALLAIVLSPGESATGEQLALLAEGARRFPRYSTLLLRIVALHLAAGQTAAAAALAELGERHARGPAAQEFTRVRAKLTAPAEAQEKR